MDPKPPARLNGTNPLHSLAAADAGEGYDYSQYYFTDTAIAAGCEWDPEIDSITAIYCVREVG